MHPVDQRLVRLPVAVAGGDPLGDQRDDRDGDRRDGDGDHGGVEADLGGEAAHAEGDISAWVNIIASYLSAVTLCGVDTSGDCQLVSFEPGD